MSTSMDFTEIASMKDMGFFIYGLQWISLPLPHLLSDLGKIIYKIVQTAMLSTCE